MKEMTRISNEAPTTPTAVILIVVCESPGVWDNPTVVAGDVSASIMVNIKPQLNMYQC